jgi:thiol:disulfide interchange protein
MTVVLHKSAVHLLFGERGRSAVANSATALLCVAASLAQAAPPQSSAVTAASGIATPAQVAPQPAPLAVDSAFPLLASFAKGEATVKFQTLPGHYLYRDRMEFELDGKRFELDAFKPNKAAKGKIKNDPSFGAVAVFEQPVAFIAGRTVANNQSAQLVVTYQGCSEIAGVCYPPTRRTFALTAGATDVPAKELEKQGLADRFKKQVSQ